MNADLLLLHGYSGSPADLFFLQKALLRKFPGAAVDNFELPEHGAGKETPPFNERIFLSAVNARCGSSSEKNRKRICIGHSTGGTILLAHLAETGIAPDLLVLIGVPANIDMSFLKRWEKHSKDLKEKTLSSTAKLVSFVNRMSKARFKKPFPVLILHGEDDELVPVEHAFILKERLGSMAREVIIPSGRHHITGTGAQQYSADAVTRAVVDVISGDDPEDSESMSNMGRIEPEISRFIRMSPVSTRHITGSPAGKRATGKEPDLFPVSNTDPVFANIEVTTKCNLECAYCIRRKMVHKGEDMEQKTFARILDLLPHAYRVTLVGLGEPLLHYNLPGIVSEAVSRGRRVGLVTNGMCLDKDTGRALLEAGLNSIAFSLDAPDQKLADIVRRGSDLERIIENIRFFTGEARKKGGISTAVFSAVSAGTVFSLEELVNLVSDLGVHILMLTDLNFIENENETLWKNISFNAASVVKKAVLSAFSRKLPVLSVKGIEEFGLWKRYDQFLLVPPEQLYRRSETRSWCASPWQTVPVNVKGDISVCDCQPEIKAGNILTEPFTGIWNGETMTGLRERMSGFRPPQACRMCPRF